jgi:hypothetical protein
MAAKPVTKLLLILIMIIAGIAGTMVARSRFQHQRRAEESRFIETYLAISIARERYIGDQDSLKIALGNIFSRYGTDSTWMASYGRKLSTDLSKSRHVWSEITNQLELMMKNPGTDSLQLNHHYQP